MPGVVHARSIQIAERAERRHQRGARPPTDARKSAADRQRHALTDRVDGTVARLLQHIEVSKNWCSGCGGFASRPCRSVSASEQMAEFVPDVRRGNRMLSEEQQTKRDRQVRPAPACTRPSFAPVSRRECSIHGRHASAGSTSKSVKASSIKSRRRNIRISKRPKIDRAGENHRNSRCRTRTMAKSISANLPPKSALQRQVTALAASNLEIMSEQGARIHAPFRFTCSRRSCASIAERRLLGSFSGGHESDRPHRYRRPIRQRRRRRRR